MTGQSSWSPAAPISNPTAFGDIPPNRHMAAPKLLRDPPDAPPKRLQPKHRRNFVRRPHHFPPRDLSPRSSLYPVYHSHTPSSPLEGVQFSMAKGVHFYLSSDTRGLVALMGWSGRAPAPSALGLAGAPKRRNTP